MLRRIFYTTIKPLLDGISRRLDRWGVTPVQMTVAGLIINIIGFILFAGGALRAGALVVLFAGLFDMLDGPLARHSGKVSLFGAFIDSVIDRYSDFLIFGGLLVYYAQDGVLNGVLLVLAVISGALLTSYTKARAEGLGMRCDVGLVERPERILIFCIGGICGWVVPMLWVLAFATHLTAIQRIHYSWLHLREETDEVRAPATEQPASDVKRET